jgi:hypothetical protein
MTNTGRTQAAWNFVNRAEWLLQEIHRMEPSVDLTWDYSVITELRSALEQLGFAEQTEY